MGNQKQKVALSSVFAGLFLTILKLIVGVVTGSIGILSEACHSGLDLIAALITYYAVWQSGKPADTTHHYGHGKVENVSAFIETILLIVTSFWIIYEAVRRLILGSVEIELTWYAFLVMGISVVIDFSRSKALHQVAMKTQSQALEADALHFKTDIYSSFVVLLGLILFGLGINRADAFAAIGVAFFVLVAAYRLGKRTVDELIDRAPEGLEEQIREIVSKIDGVSKIERIRIRKTGPIIFVDMTVNVSRNISLENVDKITKTIQDCIKRLNENADVVVHVIPIAIHGETIIERVQTIVSNHNLAAHDINVYTAGNKTSINFDLGVGSNLSLSDAHKKASHIEKTILEEFGKKTKINIHIEPLESQATKVEEINEKEIEKITSIIDRAKQSLRFIKNIHDIEINKINGRYFISLHFIYEGKKSIEDAHQQAGKLEEKIKELLWQVESVNTHSEPL